MIVLKVLGLLAFIFAAAWILNAAGEEAAAIREQQDKERHV